MPSLLIADDDQDFLEELGDFCKYLSIESQRFDLVGMCKDGNEAITAMHTTLPDLAILDIEMPGFNGVEVAIKTREFSPKTKILIYSGHSNRFKFDELAKAGICGYLLKASPLSYLEKALKAILDDGIWFDPSMLHNTYQMLLDTAQNVEQKKSVLDPFDKRLIELIHQGHTNTKIATQLNMNPNTIKTQVQKLCQKMGYESRDELRQHIHKWI
jgi:DNA-binding NarL/FixJ family response regulator